MPIEKQNYFLYGNIVLAIALLCLLFMGTLWEMIGSMAMVLWIVLAAVGVTLLMKGQDNNPGI